MIEVGRGFFVGIADNVNLSDIVNDPDAHHWLVGWEFPDDEKRNRRATPTGKAYGSSNTFQAIYDMLDDDFISLYFDEMFLYSDVAERGEDLLHDLGVELRISVKSYVSREGEVKEFERKLDINATRAQNAEDRYNAYWEQAEQRLDEIDSDIDYYASNARYTASGYIDRRTREAHQIARLQREKEEIWAESDRLSRNMEREQARSRNAYIKYNEALDSLRDIQHNLDIFDGKFEYQAEEFAKMIKSDIISKGRNGMLPMQNVPLAERTIRNRRYAGISPYPKYWATGQLIRSINITCKLV